MLFIRPSLASEAAILATVAWRAKALWGYSVDVLERWRSELSPTAASINSAPTYVAEIDGVIAGWCQISINTHPIELEHLWVHPTFMRLGVGRALITKVCAHLSLQGVPRLIIDADPNAAPFYSHCGAVRVGEIAAPIPGSPTRVRPLFELDVSIHADTSSTVHPGE